MKTRHLLTLGWLAMLAAPALATAQIIFTVHATANSNALGYTAGQAATFTYTLRDFGATAANGNAGGSSYIWIEEALSHPEIWSSVSGTRLTGTWIRPDTTNGAPYSDLVVLNGNQLELFASHDTDITGLRVNGLDVQTVKFYASYTGLSFSNFTNTLPNPATYFADYVGTYAAASTLDARVVTDSFSTAYFTVDSLTISSAIPEPATYGVVLASAALLAMLARRRRAGQAPALPTVQP